MKQPKEIAMKRRKFLQQAGAATAATGVVLAGAPAIHAQKRLEIVMVTTWPRDLPGLGTGAQRFAQRLTDMTDGRINVQYYSAGERVGAFDSFDEVASGNAQMYHAADYYWVGKHPAWGYFTSVPFGMTCREINSWIRFGGGQELWDELAESFGLKCLPCGNTGAQMGGWFKKEINSPDDLKGLKMRIPGLGGNFMTKLGVSPVAIPASQIYENLMSGALDAAEWVGPWNDIYLKFYEAAKYYYPGVHEPGSLLSLGMNKAWWESLSKSDQTLIEAAISMENDVMTAEFYAKNSESLEKLVTEQGVQLRRYTDEVYDAFGDAAIEVFEETQAHSELANRVHLSFEKSMKNVSTWVQASDQAYLSQRSRVLGV